MATQIRLELYKMMKRPRSYLGPIALAVIAGLMVAGLRLGPPPLEHSVGPGFMTVGSLLTGGFVAWVLLPVCTAFFLPLFASVVVGDLISGEAGDGTLRMALSRSVGRGQLYVGKYAAAVIYVVSLTFFLGVTAYVLGGLFLGRGALVTFQQGAMFGAGGIQIYPEVEGLIRLAGAYAYASVLVLAVATIAYFASTMVSNSLGAIGGAMMVLILSGVVGAIDYFSPVHPYLISSYMDGWSGLMADPVPWRDLAKSTGALLGYIAVFFTVGLMIFRRKDVLS